jgi:hypothetical protein
MFPANMYVVRRAHDDDAGALQRLAALDGRAPLSGDILVAQKDGVIAAAISLDDGRTLTDEVHRTPEAVALLRLRADAMRAMERTPSLPLRLRAAVRVPKVAKLGTAAA